MKRRSKKRQKLVRGMPSAVLLSIAIHVALFLLAGMLVVFTVVKKEEKRFEPPQAVERPKMKLKKPKVKIKKTSRPKPTTRIVTKINRASMPDIQLPEMSGMGGELGAGLDGFDMMPDLSEVSLFGSGQSIGNDFEGTLYDFKRDRKNRSIPYSQEGYREIVRDFIMSGWKTAKVSRYYQSPKKLYATTFVVPTVLSEIAPAAFGEKEMEGNYWMVHYKGQLVHRDGITFRFLGSGDEMIVVRVGGKIVLGSAWWYDEPRILGDIWRSRSADSKKYWLGNQTATMGDWITLEPGVPLEMEIVMTDNGGQACLMLGVQEKGVEYEMRTVGGPIFPAFKTAELSHDILDAIYKDMVPDELNLTNGPVFCDYDSSGRKAISDPGRSESPSVSPESTIDDSMPRKWTSTGGKTFEAEYVTVMGDKVVLRSSSGTLKKMPLERLSPEDNVFIGLANPPDLLVSIAKKVSSRCSIVQGGSSGNTIGYTYVYTAKVKQTSAGAYNHELHVEFFAIGAEIHGDRYVLLDYQESRFTPNKENQRSHRFSGIPVEVPNFTLERIHRGIKDSGFLVVVRDSRGRIIDYDTSAKWLFKNRENLKNLPVGAYMDKTCTRVFPTGPKRTRY